MNAADKAQLIEYAKMAKNKGLNRIYLHWTAGYYGQVFDDYHACIRGDEGHNGEVYFMTDDFAEKKNHTWKRNTNAIGLSLCCCVGAIANQGYNADFGKCPPTTEQIESMAQTVAVLCQELEIPLDKDHVMTHCEAALLDGYGPYQGDPDLRWDLWYLPDYDGQMKPGGDVIRGKAAWFMSHKF